MARLYGWNGRTLLINLNTGKAAQLRLEKALAHNYIGGRGLNIKALYDNLTPRIDPFSPDNIIILGAGPCNGTLAPSSTRLTITTKSPLTGLIGDGNLGSPIGAELKYAGYDMVIITGKTSKPSYILIDDDDVEIKEASALWGMTTSLAEKAVKEELGDPEICVITIGPAGERLVRFSNVIAEFGANAGGRGGIGAVLGSKNVKAIAVRGTKGVKVANNNLLEKVLKEIECMIETFECYKEMRIYGSGNAMFVKMNRMGAAIVKNYQLGTIEKLDRQLSPKVLSKYNLKSISCLSCPVGCLPFYVVETGPYAGIHSAGLKFTNLQQCGPQLGVTDMDFIIKLNTVCSEYGMDVCDLGGVLGYIFESYEKGFLSADDLNGIEAKWGDHEAILKMTEMIVQRIGIGNILAEGLKIAPKIIGKGTEKFALHVKGMAFSTSDPRAFQGWALGFAVASRGADHMRACASAERQIPYGYTTEKKGELIAIFENLRAIEDSFIICKILFWQHMINVVEAFKNGSERLKKKMITIYLESLGNLYRAVTGRNLRIDDLMTIGERIINLERLFNLREGLRVNDDTLPERFLKEAIPKGKSKGKTVKLKPMLDEYYKARGWSIETGIPTKAKLATLGLLEEAKKLQMCEYSSDEN